MRELGLDLAQVRTFFVEDPGQAFALIRVPVDVTDHWTDLLGVPARRCYVSDGEAAANVTRTRLSLSEVVAAKTPDPGSVMAGDFGEILTAFFLAASAHPAEVLDPKKWRLKQDRTKPAPHSDVVQFLLPEWPKSSANDRLVCSEVKTKSTAGKSTPIESTIEDSGKDRSGRLLKTLIWLKARAIGQDLGTVNLDHLERFIKAVDHPPFTRDFRAVAVICSSLLDAEIAGIKPPPKDECTLVVISVPDLKNNYEALYAAIAASVA